MHIVQPSIIQRDDLIESYVCLQSRFIALSTGTDLVSAEAKVRDIVKDRYTPKTVHDVRTLSPGNREEYTGDLLAYLRGLNNKIITPAGSSYITPDKGKSIIVQMIEEKVAERSRIKKMQLKAINDGDEILGHRCWYQQASIKINNNSIPGGFASPYNIFYDKGGYNTITATARCMIARANAITEQLLGGNFAWFSEEELINWIIYSLKHKPNDDVILATIEKYGLMVPDKTMLLDFYQGTLRKYIPSANPTAVRTLVDTLSSTELTFLFYMGNLRHLIWYNQDSFRKYFSYVFDHTALELDNTVTADAVKSINGAILNFVTITFSKQLEQCSVSDITTKRKDLLPKLIALCLRTTKRLSAMDQLFDTFINTGSDVPLTDLKPNMMRNTVILSDTDSVIFTAAAWDDWYRHDTYGIADESYMITALVVYWLERTIQHALQRASVLFGATGDSINTLSMKNEFTFSVILLYNNKKTYVVLQINQEGVVFKEPKPDIKGQALKGSSICHTSLAFVEDMLVNQILIPTSAHKILAKDLIQKTVEFELKIKDSLLRGETEFLKLTSIKDAKHYKTPESAFILTAFGFWQQVCSVDHGDVMPPAKVAYFSTLKPTKKTLDELAVRFPEFYARLAAYLKEKSFPNNILINPLCNRIPEELVPFVDVRSIIWHNIQPVYLTLAKLNISVGGEESKLLFSDIYS